MTRVPDIKVKIKTVMSEQLRESLLSSLATFSWKNSLHSAYILNDI